ncbi:hypothetical protein CDD83_11042 [Cordyceps sp. RAO-2017]|nr:hypothetical protein CDD83_11042 [Cordyceps sp. RAO-2017]
MKASTAVLALCATVATAGPISLSRRAVDTPQNHPDSSLVSDPRHSIAESSSGSATTTSNENHSTGPESKTGALGEERGPVDPKQRIDDYTPPFTTSWVGAFSSDCYEAAAC